VTLTIEDRYYLSEEVPDVEVRCVVEVVRLGYDVECGELCDDVPVCGAHMREVDAERISYETYRRYLEHASV